MSNNISSKHILVVDDDPVITKMLDSRLQANGYKTSVSTEAADGLQTAMDENPDLIILDVMMPIINGYNFCRLLKQQENKKKIPVVFLTSRDEKADFEIGREMGAEAYLTKPVDMDLLFDTIKRLIP